MQPDRRVPGESGIWVLILGELAVFSAFFVWIALTRREAPEAFRLSQALLNQPLGMTNTVLLLTGSLLVALALHRVRGGVPGAAQLLLGAMATGAAFVVIKLIEYGEKIQAGQTISSSEFNLLYFALTGVHLIHVLAAIGMLAVLVRSVGLERTEGRMMLIECGALFWHLVDLLWIVLFALFYLAG